MVPDTDFPDIRNKSLVHSNHGSALLVPREKDRVRIYMQLEDKDIINPATGRVDKERMGPDELLEVSDIRPMDQQLLISPLGCPKIALPLQA
jgi:phenol 2-monooxygenase